MRADFLSCFENGVTYNKEESRNAHSSESLPIQPSVFWDSTKSNEMKAINDVGLFQYIEKPWDNEDILIIFRNGLEKQRLMKRLDEKISEINKAYMELQELQREIVKTFV